MKRRAFFTIIATAVIICCLTSCTANSGENIVFGTFYNIKVSGKNSNKALNSVTDELLPELEALLSTNLEDSEVSKINAAPENTPIAVSEITLRLFSIAKELSKTTEGNFNPAIFPLVELWHFSPDTFTGVAPEMPSSEKVSETLDLCSLEYFLVDETAGTITKTKAGAKLDFGAIAKGYAADLAAERLSEQISSLINIGGSLLSFGEEKNIGVAHPREKNSVFATTLLNGQAIATSGDYERYYFENNVRFCHIIDKNGYPVGIFDSNPIISVTVVGKSATVCDALSTALFASNIALTEDILTKLSYSALIITENGYYTIGEQHFEIQANYPKL